MVEQIVLLLGGVAACFVIMGFIGRNVPVWWMRLQLWREPWRSWSTLEPEEINRLWATDAGRRQIVDSLDRDWKLPKGK